MNQYQNQEPVPDHQQQIPSYVSNYSMDPFFQLRRDWEHAFHVHTIKGQSTDHLQQLMHSQFTFLEHVVLGKFGSLFVHFDLLD